MHWNNVPRQYAVPVPVNNSFKVALKSSPLIICNMVKLSNKLAHLFGL
jgi:hypothetical protein